MTNFTELGLSAPLLKALTEMGIETPTPIQEQAIPILIGEPRNFIGLAQTGTGKTAAFGLPLLEVLKPELRHTQALILAPTRELGQQIAQQIQLFAKYTSTIRIVVVYGGASIVEQMRALKNTPHIIIATPGRLMDLMSRKALSITNISHVILDEADEMLNMGFKEDIDEILSHTPEDKVTWLFSATMPGQIVALARRYMTQPTHIRASDPTSDSSTVDAIEQHVWRCHQMDKPELVARVLQAEGRGLTMIFCRTKRVAGNLAEDLANRGFASAAVHGDLGQGAREQALRAFRSGKVDVLVATDVAARGIDVADVTHVINYECPDDEKTYLHRVGRTGRAGASGVAITLVDWQDINRWQMINRMLGMDFNEPVETYSSSDHVYEGLGIPKGTTGELPGSARTREGLAGEKLEDLGETGANKGRRSGTGKPQTGKSGSGAKSNSNNRNSASKPRSTSSGDTSTKATAEKAPAKERTPRQRSRTRGTQKDA